MRLAVVTMSPWPPENPHRPQENPNPALSLDILAASPRIRRSLHAPIGTFHRDRGHLTDVAVMSGGLPPWPPGNPYRPHENPSPALSTGRPRHAPTEPLKPLPAQPRHQEACTGDFTVGGHRRTANHRGQGPRES